MLVTVEQASVDFGVPITTGRFGFIDGTLVQEYTNKDQTKSIWLGKSEKGVMVLSQNEEDVVDVARFH